MEYKSEEKLTFNRSINITTGISSILIGLFFVIYLTIFFKVIPLMLGNILFVLLGSIAIIYSAFKNGIKKQIPIFCFIYFYIFFGVLGLLFNGNIELQELLWPFAFIGLTTLLLNFRVNHKFAKTIYYFVVALIMIKIILAGGVNNLNTTGSRNMIGIIVLISLSIYIIASFMQGSRVTIYPILLGLLVNVLAIGRSGILTFLLLTILFLPFKFDGEKYKIRNPIKSFFVLFIMIIILWISYNLLEFYFAEMISNFQSRGLESIRKQIWSDYLKKTFTSARYILFGTPISGTNLLDMFNENLHNSFLMLHAKYGFIPLMIVIILIIKALIHFIKTKNVLFFIIMIVLVFRMQFDYTNFNAQLDIILFYFMFFPYAKNNYNMRIKKNLKR